MTQTATSPDDALARAIRKAAWRFLPLLTIAYLFNYFDRTCLGFAALTMNRQIGLSDAQFGFGAGIFFLGYCLFEVPSNLMLYRVGARRWLARIMISWGLLSALMAFVVGPNSYYAVRVLLGIAEAGFFPGVTFFLASWFPPQYRTRMIALFLIGIPGSSLIGGPLCGYLLKLDGIWGLAGWQWMFLFVSLPCVPLGFLTLRYLSDDPASAAWLRDDERQALQEALAGETRERPQASFWATLKDVRVLILAGIEFAFIVSTYGIGIWMPLILKEYNLSTLSISWLSAIPYLFATAVMVLWSSQVDRQGRPIFHLALALLLGGIGLLPVMAGSLPLTLLAFSLALIGTSAARAFFWTIPTRFLTGAAAAGGLAFINAVGTAGGFVGPVMMGWLKQFSGSYNAGLAGIGAMMVIACLLAASLKLVIRRQ